MLGSIRSLMGLEVGNSGGFGFGLGALVSHALRQEAHPGISKHVHVTLVRPDSIDTQQLDMTHFTAAGEPIAQVMPLVARSWNEFKSLAGSRNLQAGSATAGEKKCLAQPLPLGRPASPSAGEE